MTTRVVHCKKEPFDVLIDRSTKWGNPFSHKVGTKAKFIVGSRDEAVDAYFNWLFSSEEGKALFRCIRSELKDKVLACWCKPQRCHGDVLARIADADFRKFINYPIELSDEVLRECGFEQAKLKKPGRKKKKAKHSCDLCDKGVPHRSCF